MRAIVLIGLSLAICAILMSWHSIGQDAPMLKPQCDARMIAEHSGLRREAYIEVIDMMERDGAIDNAYATRLRALIAEAYATKDLEAWVKQQCAP
jgi:hypothetical protein